MSRAFRSAALLLAPAALAACAGHRAQRAPAPSPPPATQAHAAAPAPAPTSPAEPASVTSAPVAAADAFASRILPMLEQHCTPCHFPGGRMYDRLPFDDPEVVRSKPEGILRRLKVAEERQVVEEWIRGASGSR